MAGLGIDGLISGLDTTSIISKLMTIEAQPQTLLKNSLTSTTSFANDLRALNSQIAGLATAAKAASGTSSLNVFSTSSSASSVTATASSTASAGSITFTVGATAQSQVVVTKAMSTWPSTPPVLTIVGSDGTQTEFTAKSGSMPDIAAAVNAAGAGVTASAVAAGTDANGVAQYRLQLTSTKSGADGAFTIYRGAKANIGKGGPNGAVNLATETGAATVSTARDASVTLWGGTSAAQTITSASNTFTDLLPGLNVTVTKVESTSVTVTTAQDNTAAASVAGKLFTSLINLFSGIADKTAVTTSTTDGVKAGSFVGDSSVRQAKDALLAAATSPIGGKSLSTIGINITKTGTIEFDATAFAAALAKDPTGTAATFQQVAGRIEAAATAASDSTKGYLTGKVTGEDAEIKSLGDRIADWDLRLAMRKDTMQKQYTALETALGSLKSQSDWLASQLGSLMSSSSSSSE